MKEKILVIVGPTASGKTSLAVWLAQRLNGEVISADSRQVYKHLDIGTAKITSEEMDGIPHHLIDIREPEESYSASDFMQDASLLITEIRERGHVPIIAGGTFQYVDALLGKQSIPRVSPNSKLRERLDMLGTSRLVTMLEEKDPVRARDIDRHNRRRLIRALEIIDALGKVPVPEKKDSPYDVFLIGLRMPAEILKEKIFTRLDTRINQGLVDETKKVLDRGMSKERLQEMGLEYRVALEHIDGLLTETEMRQKLKEKVWQYAKRQLTWLKKMEGVVWFEPSEREEMLKEVRKYLNCNY